MTLSFDIRSFDIRYAYMDTPLAVLPVRPFSNDFDYDKSQYVINLSEKEVSQCNEEFEMGLYKLSMDTLKLLDSHLSGTFNECYSVSVRADMVDSLLRTAPCEWKDILDKAKYVIRDSRKGHDIAWATKILCSVTATEYRREVVNIANKLCDCDDDSRIRVRILAALVLLPLSEINKLKMDYELGTAFAQAIRYDFQNTYGIKV